MIEFIAVSDWEQHGIELSHSSYIYTISGSNVYVLLVFVNLPRLFEVKDAKETRGGGREDDMGAWECCARSHFGAS